jgi:3-hydroxybutyryl-CoA dehydrogenase
MFASTGDLVIESVREDYETKINLLTQIGNLMSLDSILVSNTSSLSIEDLAMGLKRKQNFAGLHFFNPATKMDLVEIVAGKETSPETISALRQLAERLGKTAVTVKDTPGFIVNRLLLVQINNAIGLLENGVATAEDIDRAIMSGLGHKKGPLALADFIGLDVVCSILESIYKATNDSAYKPSSLLMQMNIEKKMGRKSGCGFFKY